MEIAKLDHINMTVNSLEESQKFYLEFFGLEKVEGGKTPDGRAWGILSNGVLSLCLYEESRKKPEGDHDFHKMYHFAISIPEKTQESFIQLKEERKIKPSYPSPVNYPHSTSWYIYDPSGHSIEVVFWKNNEVKF